MNVSGRRQERPAGRPAESVETLGVGSGGTWQPHREGLLSPDALESGETLRKVAVAEARFPAGIEANRRRVDGRFEALKGR